MVTLDVDAISGICGSISIACWVVVFSPQIVENFRRSSAEGLSIVFVIVWLAGDVFNIAGAVLQHTLPTMIILAVYYTLADIVLLAQCFYYRGFTFSDSVPSKDDVANSSNDLVGADSAQPTERTGLLANSNPNGAYSPPILSTENGLSASHSRRASFRAQLQDQFQHLDGTKLSPATPMHPGHRDEDVLRAHNLRVRNRSIIKAVLFNLTAVLVVCAAGVLGWWLSVGSSSRTPHHHDKAEKDATQHFNVLGQVFGYICAVLYLGSRLPQLLLNYRRKSTEGISMLFFLFACVGNLTYVLSIMAFEPKCTAVHHGRVVVGARYCEPEESRDLYLQNFLVNFSWLLGSFGTLLLDAAVFVQFFIYRQKHQEVNESAIED